MEYYDRYGKYNDAQFENLKGKTLTSIEGAEKGSDQIKFHCADGEEFGLTYYQDCCAHCDIEDICGDIQDLIGSEILLAELVINDKPEGSILDERKAAYEKQKAEFTPKYEGDEFYAWGPTPSNDFCEESETWAFYKLATIKGSVTLRWYGSSNGYYSETATFEKRII